MERRRSRAGAQGLEHLAVFGESPHLVLGEDQLAIDGHVEDTAVSLHELDFTAELPLDLGRQTGGPGQVVSANAVLDGDGHGRTSWFPPEDSPERRRATIGPCYAPSRRRPGTTPDPEV